MRFAVLSALICSAAAVGPQPCADPILLTSFTDSSELDSTRTLTFAGGFRMEADVTVNAVTSWGRVFDFSNGQDQDNVLLGLDGGKWNAHVYHDTTRQAGIADPVASPLGVEMSMVLVYTRTSSGGPTTGTAVLYIDGVERVSGYVALPLMVTRTINLVERSPWVQDTPLDGTVKNFKFYACDATNAPDTDAPPTDAPPTDAPATDAPATDAPPTDAPATVAPDTNAPPTDAPATDAPDTSAPPTDAPDTDAPSTDAPPTDAPATVAPDTDAPPTDVPATDAPDTNAPPTDAPATDAPDTSAPPTDAPDTNAPPTDAPATDAPATDAPDTDAPATDAPPTDAPATVAPGTDAPPTDAPATDAPDTSAPPTDAPDTDAPSTDAPATDAPATDATDAPATDAPDTDAPATDAPPTDAPATVAPGTDAPPTDAPATDAPDTSAPPTDAPDTNAPSTDVPATDAPATDAPATDAPDTTAPPTDAPATNAPDTMAPLTPAPLPTAPVTSAPTTVPTPASTATQPPQTAPPAQVTLVPETPFPETPLPTAAPTPSAVPALTLPPASTATQPPQTAPPAQVTLVPETPFPATPLPTAPALPLPPASPTPAGFATATPPGTPAPGGFATPLPTAAQTAAPQTQPTTTAATAAPDTPTPPDTEAPGMAVGTGAPTALPGGTAGPATIVPWVEPEPGVVGAGLEVTQSPISPGTVMLSEYGVVMAVVASVGAFAGAPHPSVRLGLMSERCEVGSQSTQLSRLMNPTGLVIYDSEAMGAVVGNLSIVLVTTLICLAAVHLAKTLGPRIFPTFFDGLDVQGFLRVPSVPIFVFFVVYQGITLGAMRILIIARSPVHVLVGVIVIPCMGLVVPYMLFSLMHRSVPKRATYHLVQKRAYPIEFLLGPGEWVNTGRQYMWSQRYICMLLPYREGCAWYSCLQLCASLALSAIQSTRPESQLGCAYMKSAQGAVILVVMLLEMFLRPSARMRDTVLLSISTAIQVVAMVFHALAHSESNTLGWHYTFGTTLLVGAGAILLIKMALDFLTELYVFITRRRVRAQKDFYKRQSQRDQLPSFYDYEADEELGAALNTILSVPTSTTPVETPRERPLSTEIFTPKSSSTSLSGRGGIAWVPGRSSRVRSMSSGNNPLLSLACVASSMDSLGSQVYSPSTVSDRRRSGRSRAGTSLTPRYPSSPLTADVMSATSKTKPTSLSGLRVLS